MERASEALKAERLNHARKLLQRFDHLPDAVAQMVKDLRSFSSSSLSLSPASTAPEATGSYRRCQNRFYRQTFPKVGSASSRFGEQDRLVVERDRQPSATGGIAAATRAWLSAPSSTATLFTLNIALIVCSPRKSRKPTNFSFPKYATQLDRRN